MKIATLLICALTLTVVSMSDARAAVPTADVSVHSKAFRMSKTVIAHRANICVTFTISGKLTWRKNEARGRILTVISDRQLEEPTLVIKSAKGTKCRLKNQLLQAELTETWYEQGCGASGVDIAVGGGSWVPSIGTTLTCKNAVKKAELKANFDSKSSTYRLNNSGRAPGLPHTVLVRAKRPICTLVDTSASILTDRNDRDNVGATFHVCAS